MEWNGRCVRLSLVTPGPGECEKWISISRPPERKRAHLDRLQRIAIPARKEKKEANEIKTGPPKINKSNKKHPTTTRLRATRNVRGLNEILAASFTFSVSFSSSFPKLLVTPFKMGSKTRQASRLNLGGDKNAPQK